MSFQSKQLRLPPLRRRKERRLSGGPNALVLIQRWRRLSSKVPNQSTPLARAFNGPEMSNLCLLQLAMHLGKRSIYVRIKHLTIHLVLLQAGKRNPVYLFFEIVSSNAEKNAGAEGDIHYRCYHGNRKVLTITRAMKGCLNGEAWPILHFMH